MVGGGVGAVVGGGGGGGDGGLGPIRVHKGFNLGFIRALQNHFAAPCKMPCKK